MGSSRYNNRFYNNTISGFATGVYRQTANDPQTRGNFNNFYNNTTNVTNYTQGPNDLALNPSFTDISAVTGTTATSFNYTLTDNAADFSSVVDGESTLHVFSGTGATVLFSTVVSHTLHTVTIAPGTGTSVAGDIVYQVSIGRNFSIGTNLKAAAAFVLPGTAATSYLDIGAVQRQEAGAATVTTARAYVG